MQAESGERINGARDPHRSAGGAHVIKNHPLNEAANRYIRNLATEEEIGHLQAPENLEDTRAAVREIYNSLEAQLSDRGAQAEQVKNECLARACYELGRKSHRNADFTVSLVPSRSLFSAFLSRF